MSKLEDIKWKAIIWQLRVPAEPYRGEKLRTHTFRGSCEGTRCLGTARFMIPRRQYTFPPRVFFECAYCPSWASVGVDHTFYAACWT